MKKKNLFGIASLLFILGLVFLFLKGWEDSEESCFYFIFGEKGKETFLGEVGGWDASFGLIVAFILLLVGLAASILSFVGIGSKIMPLVAAGCGIVASILFFCAVSLGCSANNIEDLKDNIDLGIGFILSGIFTLLGGIAAGASLSLKK